MYFFYLQEILVRHGRALQVKGQKGIILPPLRELLKTLTRQHEDLAFTSEGNLYLLQYLTSERSTQLGEVEDDVSTEGSKKKLKV